MKLFQNLFKPKWKNSNPEIRKQALISLDRDTNQSVFSEVVKQDNTSELRQLAVKRINDLDELITIAAKNSDEKVRETARKITSQILAGITDITSKQAVDESTRIERINSIDSQKTLEFIAQKGDTSAIRLAAINKVSREALLGDLAINDEDPKIRKQVAEKLHQKSTLERVLKAIKNKDKQISKIVKDKLDQITAEEERPRLVLSKQKSLCLCMEQLGKKGLWERDKVQFDQLKRQWQELASENTLALLELQQRFNAAAESFQTDYDAYLERNEARLKQEAALLPLKKEKQAILEQLHQLLKHITTDRTDDEINTVDTFNQQLNSLVNNWNSIEKLPGDIEEDFTRQYQDAIKSVKSIIIEIDSGNKATVDLTSIHSEIDRLIKQGFKLKLSKINSLEKRLQSIRVDDPDLQQKKSDLTALIRKAELIIEKNETRANNTFTETQNLLNELEIHLNNGEIKNANDTQKKIQSNIKLLDKIGHKSLNTLKNQSAEFTAKLFELNKWRSWANTPQKERLITEMEALIDSDMDAKEIAFLVSKARKEWQQLGPSDRNSSQELWERFNKACDTAYEPCKAVFEDEANIRNENYNARIAFLNNLEAFINNANWEDVDWVKVENLYQQSRFEWQNLGPVDKNKRNAVNSRFNKAHNTLKTHLIDEWAKNQAIKEEIIATSQLLVEDDDLNKAINGAKELQAQWKKAGRVQRHIEHKLWATFRENCDKIFARRDSAKQQKQAEEKNLAGRKQTLCVELETLCNAPSKLIGENKDRIFEIKKAMLDIPDSDSKTDKDIKTRVDQALHIFEIKQEAAERIEQVKSLSTLKRKCELIQQLEDSINNDTQIDRNEIQSQYEALDKTPNEKWNALLEQRYNSLQNIQNKDQLHKLANLNSSKIKTSTILLEILAEIDTPDSDTAERLKIQTERLNDKLNSNVDENQWDAFLNAEANWWLTGPATHEELVSYTNRHNAVINQLKTLYAEELENY